MCVRVCVRVSTRSGDLLKVHNKIITNDSYL